MIESETKLVRCLLIGNYVVHGIESRNRYEFHNPAEQIPVDVRDIPDILSKKEVTGGCCGRPRTEQQIFELIE